MRNGIDVSVNSSTKITISGACCAAGNLAADARTRARFPVYEEDDDFRNFPRYATRKAPAA